MERKQFTFYESFAKALKRIKNEKDRAKAYDAICNYALYGENPDFDSLPDAVAIAFELIQPTLDSSRKKAESGRQGGSKQTESKTEANGKQTGREKEGEKEKEKEVEKEVENECYKSLDFFLDRINPTPSPTCTSELLDFLKVLPDDVVLHALHIAVDERKTSWSYIKAILRNYKTAGFKTVDDVLRSEDKRERDKIPEKDPYAKYGNDPFAGW